MSSFTTYKLSLPLVDNQDTRRIISLFNKFRFSLRAPLEERRMEADHDFDPTQELFQFSISTHWLAGFGKAYQIVTSSDSPECTALFHEFEENLTKYLKSRLKEERNNNLEQYSVRTDSLWDIEPSEVLDACKVVVELLKLDIDGKTISGKLVENKLLICLHDGFEV